MLVCRKPFANCSPAVAIFLPFAAACSFALFRHTQLSLSLLPKRPACLLNKNCPPAHFQAIDKRQHKSGGSVGGHGMVGPFL